MAPTKQRLAFIAIGKDVNGKFEDEKGVTDTVSNSQRRQEHRTHKKRTAPRIVDSRNNILIMAPELFGGRAGKLIRRTFFLAFAAMAFASMVF